MNSIKFSILITSYNKKKYIEECIDSCLSQNHNNYEIILIDNYSDDGSEKIFKQYFAQKPIILPPISVIFCGKINAGRNNIQITIIPKKKKILNIIFLII